MSVEDDGRLDRLKGATANENVKVMPTLLMCERRRNLHSIAREVGIIFGAAQLILANISGMSKVSTRWMSRMLTEDQKRNQLNSISCLSILQLKMASNLIPSNT